MRSGDSISSVLPWPWTPAERCEPGQNLPKPVPGGCPWLRRPL